MFHFSPPLVAEGKAKQLERLIHFLDKARYLYFEEIVNFVVFIDDDGVHIFAAHARVVITEPPLIAS